VETIVWNGAVTIDTSAAPTGINRLEFQADVATNDRGQSDRCTALWGDRLQLGWPSRQVSRSCRDGQGLPS
jgi:hypothetical protein